MPQGKPYGTAINLPAGRQKREYRESVTSGHFSGADSEAVQHLQGKGSKTLQEKAVHGERELSKSVPHKAPSADRKEMKDVLATDQTTDGSSRSLQGGAIGSANSTIGNDTVYSSHERGVYSRKKAGPSILQGLPKGKGEAGRYDSAPYDMGQGFRGGRNVYSSVNTTK